MAGSRNHRAVATPGRPRLLRLMGVFLLAAGVAGGSMMREALAETGGGGPAHRGVRVHLRGVRAVGAKGDAGGLYSEGLQDVAQKLSELPFARFTLTTNQEFSVPMHRKQSFPFGRHHSVTIRPIDEHEGVVSLWISWRDERGGKILDTRIRLAPGEQMVAGTDSDATGGTILVVSAR